MDFEQMLELLRNPTDDVEVPVTIYDDIAGAYRTSMESSTASLAEKDAMINSLNAEISRLKTVNYDKLVQGNTNGNPDEAEEESDDDGDDDAGIDDLFDDED